MQLDDEIPRLNTAMANHNSKLLALVLEQKLLLDKCNRHISIGHCIITIMLVIIIALGLTCLYLIYNH